MLAELLPRSVDVLPVASSGHGKTLGTSLEREKLAGHNPRDRSPGAGEEEYIDAHESDGSTLSRQIGSSGDRSGDGDNVLAHAHANTSEQEEVTSAEAFNHPETSYTREVSTLQMMKLSSETYGK